MRDTVARVQLPSLTLLLSDNEPPTVPDMPTRRYRGRHRLNHKANAARDWTARPWLADQNGVAR